MKVNLASTGRLSAGFRLLASLVLGAGLFGEGYGGESKPAPLVAEPGISRSVFVPGGRDPFFPESSRMPDVSKAMAPKPEIHRDLYSYLKLNSLIRSARPQVTINATTFMAGDPPAAVKLLVPNADNVPTVQKVMVQVLEFRPKSVLVSIVGQPQPREIFWHEGR